MHFQFSQDEFTDPDQIDKWKANNRQIILYGQKFLQIVCDELKKYPNKVNYQNPNNMENKKVENKTNMENDWKATLGTFFTENSSFRIEYMNKNLKTFCDEYVKFLKEFHYIHATNQIEYFGRDGSGCRIEVEMQNISRKPFKLYCVYNLDGHLFLKTTVDFDFPRENPFEDEDKNEDYYKYQEEELPEPEIFEKEYLFQLFNTRFIQYINTIKVSRMKKT